MENTWEMPQIPIVNKLGSKLAIEATCTMKLCAFNQTIDSLSENINVIAQIVVIHSSMCIVEDTHPIRQLCTLYTHCTSHKTNTATQLELQKLIFIIKVGLLPVRRLNQNAHRLFFFLMHKQDHSID